MQCSSSPQLKLDPDVIPPPSYHLLVRAQPLPQCKVCVIVPVRNEAELIENCLSSLANQVELTGENLDFRRYEVILLANNCTDNSAEIARNFAGRHPDLNLHIVELLLPPSQAYIGRVRQMLMDEAYFRLAALGLAGIGSERGIIASTDGDTQVAPTWIAATMWEIHQGADAVGGRIVADDRSCEALDPIVKMRYLDGDRYHQLIVELESHLDTNPYDRWPRHAQHYGASLAVTAQMYRQAGGMPPVRTPEDVAFYQSLLRVGARFRHSPLVEVTTSARQVVRTAGGFAAQLNEWAAMGKQQQAFLVESVEAIEDRLQTRQQLRRLWRRVVQGYRHSAKDVSACANALGVGAQWLWAELSRAHSFELLFERIEVEQQRDGVWKQRWPLVKIERAIADLSLRLQELRPQQHHAIGHSIDSTPPQLLRPIPPIECQRAVS